MPFKTSYIFNLFTSTFCNFQTIYYIPRWFKKLYSCPVNSESLSFFFQVCLLLFDILVRLTHKTREVTLTLLMLFSHRSVLRMRCQSSQITAQLLYSRVMGITEAQLTADGNNHGGNKQNLVYTHTHTEARV